MSGKFTVCAEAKRLLTLILSPTQRRVSSEGTGGGGDMCVHVCVCVCVGVAGMMG